MNPPRNASGFCISPYWKCKFPMTGSVHRSVGLLVGRSDNFRKVLHAPIGALVLH